MREPDRSKMSVWRRVRSAWVELGGDRDGSALFYTTLSLPVLMGFALLAIDGSRLMNLHSSLQHAADGLALAAAGELNHQDDSLERAKLAIQELIQNDQRFGDANEGRATPITIDDVTGRFLTSLPPDDATPISDWIEEDPNRRVAYLSDPNLDSHARASAARFIEITVKPQGFSTLMPASFVGGSDNVSASATAVAGYTRGVCYFTPMMMCNPFEGATPDLYTVAATPDFRRRMLEIRQVESNSSYFPGNFAFLRTSYGDGADALQQAMGRVDPGTCFVEDGIDTKPGQNMGKVRRGINVRFDMYTGDTSGRKGDASWRPSLNVRKGAVVGNACEPTLQSNSSYRGLPRDPEPPVSDFGDGGRIYSGDWDFDTYWEVNFGHADIDPPNHPVVPFDPDGAPPVHPVVVEGQTPVPWSSIDPPSRYEVYRYEIENDLIDQASVGGETGEPLCYTGGGLADEPDRRILHAAVVNCNGEGPLRGAEEDLPVYAFAKFFLIRPLDVGADTIDVEIVEVVAPPTDYEARDTVQLYR